MARKSMTELLNEAALVFPDNNTGMISPADLRGFFTDLVNAIKPAYAGLSRSSAGATLNIAPALVMMNGQLNNAPDEFAVDLFTNSIARSDRGTTYFNVDIDVEAPANRFIKFSLHKNGVATGGDVTVNGAGAGNPVSGSFSWLDYADPAATYTLMVSSEIDGVAVTYSAQLLAQIQPVNSYT